jgi:hypothetical protein
MTPTTLGLHQSTGGAFSMKGSEAEQRPYASEMPVQGERHFIKLPSSDKRVRRLWAHVKTAATEESAAGQPDT